MEATINTNKLDEKIESMKKILFVMMLLISTSAFASSRDEAFDQKTGAIPLLAFARPPIPTTSLPEIERTSDVKSFPDITPNLSQAQGNENSNQNGNQGGNQDSDKKGKNHSGGADGTNPGDHGNDAGTNNPGKAKGNKK